MVAQDAGDARTARAGHRRHRLRRCKAPELAASESGVAGVVMLAGTAKKGEDVLAWQTQKVKDDLLPKPVLAIMRLFRTDIVKQQAKSVARLKETTTDVARISMVRTNAKWMREMIEYDPVPTLRQVQVPLLAITGSKDVQVDPQDLDTVAASAPKAATQMIDDVDHLLRHEPAEHSSIRKYRAQAKKPLDPRVMDAIGEWLERRT